MANSFIKPEVIARMALGMLQREIVLPALVWTDAVASWEGAKDDTVSIRVPARLTARKRNLRGAAGVAAPTGRQIILDNLTETKVDLTLDEDIYSAVPVTDEELTLDIADFGAQVLAPQVRAVAEGLEDKLVDTMQGATYAETVEINFSDPYDGLVDARTALNDADVPMFGRAAVVGSSIEAAILKSDRFTKADFAGVESGQSAVREALIGRIAGFDIYSARSIDADEGYAFHRTAYVLSTRAPKVPDGVSFGEAQSYQGLALRWLRDYDFANVQDRSLVDTFAGSNVVADGAGDTFVRAVKLEFFAGS